MKTKKQISAKEVCEMLNLHFKQAQIYFEIASNQIPTVIRFRPMGKYIAMVAAYTDLFYEGLKNVLKNNLV